MIGSGIVDYTLSVSHSNYSVICWAVATYTSGVVDGVVGAGVDPQNSASRDISDVVNSTLIVVHLFVSHQHTIRYDSGV